MRSWFKDRDLAATRQWLYVAAKVYQTDYINNPDTMGPVGKFLHLFQPLVCNEPRILDWYSWHDDIFDMKRVENHKTLDFYAYQAIIALRGEWARLKERCELVLNDPPKTSNLQKYLIDDHFYLALAHGNIEAMNHAMARITEFSVVRSRTANESGSTADLIYTPGVILAKLAWRAGYEVTVDSPYVPNEWLPMEPLSRYDDHYDFLV